MKSALRGLFFLVFVVTFSFAQQTPRVVSFDAAVQIALERNLSVIQQKNIFEGQQSGVTAAYGGLLPTVGANGSWSRSQSRTENQFLNGVAVPLANTSTSNYFRTQVSADVTLFNGFGNTSNINRATSNAVAAEQNLYRARQNTVFQAQSLYLNVQRNEDLVRVGEDNLKRSQGQLDQIVEMNHLGAKAIADVYRQQYQVGNDELALIQAQNNFEKAKADLILFLGLDIIDYYQFSDPTIKAEVDTAEFAVLNAQYKDFQALTRQALSLRPDYKSVIESMNAASSSITMAQSGYLPIVNGSVAYGLSAADINKLNDNKTLSWGISVSVPLFNGFQTDNQVQTARVTYRNAEAQMIQTERSVQVDIKKALLDLDAAMKQVDVSQKNVLSANEDRKIQEEKYRLGASTLLDLLTANANYSTALSNKINAVYNYITAKKNVDLAVGTIPY